MSNTDGDGAQQQDRVNHKLLWPIYKVPATQLAIFGLGFGAGVLWTALALLADPTSPMWYVVLSFIFTIPSSILLWLHRD